MLAFLFTVNIFLLYDSEIRPTSSITFLSIPTKKLCQQHLLIYSTISYATFRDKTVDKSRGLILLKQQKVNRTLFARECHHISSIRAVNAHAHSWSNKEIATKKDVGHDGCPILSPKRRNYESYCLSNNI